MIQRKTEISTRCNWLDFAKGIAILLVVVGHALQYYLYPYTFNEELSWRCIYSFHMPFFFILSGIASSFSRTSQFALKFVLNKSRRLMLPFLCWATIDYALMQLLTGGGNFLKYIITPSHGLWYLWSLFFIVILHTLVITLSNRTLLRIVNSVAIYVLLICISNIALGRFGLVEISRYYIFFSLGYFLKVLGVIDYVISRRFLSYTIVITCIVIWGMLFTLYSYDANSYIKWIIRTFLALSGSLSALFISIRLADLNYAKASVEKLGINTMGIYAVNSYVIYALAIIFSHTLWCFPIAVILDVIISLAISLILNKLAVSRKLLLGQLNQDIHK